MQVPFKPIEFLSRDIKVERRPDGTVVLQSNHALQPYARHVPALLARWAVEVPDRLWLAQRRGPERDWLKVTYGEARRQVDSVTQALLGTNAPAPVDETPSLARAEWEYIHRVLADCQNNVSEAARRLGLHRRSLQRKLQKHPPTK